MEINNSTELQLCANAKALEWGHLYLKGVELDEFRKTLIRNRIQLKRLKYANSVNPAVAIFGESQVGKSYMADCLLTSETEVLNFYDGEYRPTGFIESINPLGGGKESTSLISRFTTKQVWSNPSYPIKASMLTPIDLIMVLLDTYYNDVTRHNFPKKEQVEEEIERLKKAFQSKEPVQEIITEDEIYELKEYLSSDLVQRGDIFRNQLFETRYFETLATFIAHVGYEQWADVFSFLWNRNSILTETFHQLVKTLHRMDFSRVVYLKMASVLRETGTILCVDRLYTLFDIDQVAKEDGSKHKVEKASEPFMEVLTEKGTELKGIDKSEFCALAMELAFTIVDLSNKDKVDAMYKEKPFLKYCDVLDFPGARSRKMIPETDIDRITACELVLRGKIAYLFNKYSQQFLITNLLFCHHQVQSEVVTLSSLLKGWVESVVGKTPEERKYFMDKMGISPLFLIGTKFNVDLEKTPDDSKGNEEARKTAREYRWNRRFDNLENLIKSNWLNEWETGKPFRNLYLLRSFEYSCQRGIFTGYQKEESFVNAEGETEKLWKLVYGPDGKLQGEQNFGEGYAEFLSKLKKSFLQNAFVQSHFEDPEVSWDEAASIKKDGTEYIIRQLSFSSEKMKDSRNLQFERVAREAFNGLADALCMRYHDDNSDLELKKQCQTAGAISFTFDALFGHDKYFFTDFISSMIISEEQLHDVVMDVINNAKVLAAVDLSALFAIRAKAKVDNTLSFEENKLRIMRAYKRETEQELKKMLDEKHITLEDIINPPKVMNFSRIITDAVEQTWSKTRLDVSHYNEFIQRGLSETELKQLLDNMRVLYKEKLKMSDKIAQRIHPFISSAIDLACMADMLADICAEMINRFVNTMGAAYYDEELWKDVQKTIEYNGFDIRLPAGQTDALTFDKEEIRKTLPEVFDTFENVDQILNETTVDNKRLENFSNYQEFRRWSDCMLVSFLATKGIPKYDRAMNDALRTLMLTTLVRQDGLKDLIRSHSQLNSLQTLQENEHD